MGWRFRKRIKILPGIHINLSKSGISTNVGVKGASVTFGPKRKTYANIGFQVQVCIGGMWSQGTALLKNPKELLNISMFHQASTTILRSRIIVVAYLAFLIDCLLLRKIV